jgi:sulfonate transport system substrate-binding protein
VVKPIGRNTVTKKIVLVACVLAVAAVGIYCFVKFGSPATPPKDLVIGGPKNISMLVILADKKGYFASESVNCRFEPLQSGKLAMDSVLNGDIDIGVLVDANIAYIKFRPGADVKVLCSILEKNDDAIVARRDHGITKADDLAGKKIGYFTATTSHVFLARFLASHKIPVAEKDLLPMAPPAMEAAIVRGDIDAVCVWQPFRFNAMQKLGENGIEFGDKTAYTAQALLAARGAFVNEHADECRRVIRALIKAQEFVEKNPDEAIAILSQEVGVDPKTLRSVWGEYILRLRLDPGLLTLIKEEGAWIKDTDSEFKDKALPLYNDVLSPEILRSVSPLRVGTL